MTGSGRRPPPPPVSTTVCRESPVSRLSSGRSRSGCPREARLQPTLGRSKPVGTDRPGRGRQLLTGLSRSRPPGRSVQPGLCYRERPANRLRSVAIGRASPPPPPPPPPLPPPPPPPPLLAVREYTVGPASARPRLRPDRQTTRQLAVWVSAVLRLPTAEAPPPRTVAPQKWQDCAGRTLAGRVQLVHMLLYGDWR